MVIYGGFRVFDRGGTVVALQGTSDMFVGEVR
jgi:hypothetical protein